MRQFDAFPAVRADRPATAVLHDEASIRLVAFVLGGDQVIREHRSPATVVVHVVSGTGIFRGETDERELSAGQGAVFAPNESHAITAGPEGLQFVAAITPGPTASVRSAGAQAAEAGSS
jgi:quercetin dioxygenase-like cupin family protein